jgi:hypothetical protein
VQAEGRTKNVLKWVGWARYLQFWQLCERQLDNGDKFYGEAIEWFPGGARIASGSTRSDNSSTARYGVAALDNSTRSWRT